jgi:hypothetical protein
LVMCKLLPALFGGYHIMTRLAFDLVLITMYHFWTDLDYGYIIIVFIPFVGLWFSYNFISVLTYRFFLIYFSIGFCHSLLVTLVGIIRYSPFSFTLYLMIQYQII